MKLSIITINRNNKDGLEKTIRSVIAQTCRDYEYIVIDGASTDGSADIIRQYEKKISCWISEPDQGIYNAMNKGILQAHGDYCIFMNSGDCFHDPDVIARFESYFNHRNAIVVGRITYLDDPVGWCPDTRQTFRRYWGNHLPHQASFIRRDLFEHIGLYSENYKIASDFCFFFKAILIEKATILVIDSPVAVQESKGISSVARKLLEAEKLLFLKNELHWKWQILYYILIHYEKGKRLLLSPVLKWLIPRKYAKLRWNEK